MSLWARVSRAIVFGMLVVTLLAGCATPTLPALPWQTHEIQPLPDARQILHISASGIHANAYPSPFDPVQQPANGYAGQMMLSLLYSNLFTFDAHGRPTPSLAASYTVSEDGLSYTLRLRPHARFSDGAPITAADVAFSLDRAALACSDSAVSYNFPSLKGQPPYNPSTCPPGATLVGSALLAPDPATVIINLSRPDGALLSKLAESYCDIVERSFVRQYGVRWPNLLAVHPGQGTSGMYQLRSLATDVSGGTTVALERSQMWWGTLPRVREVILQLRGPQSAPTGDVSFDQLNGATKQPSGILHAGYTLEPNRTVEYIALDPDHGFGDPRLRQALALALDKSALAVLLGGDPTNHLIPPETDAYPTTLDGDIATAPLTGDVMRAQALWQAYVRDRCGDDAARCPLLPLSWFELGGSGFSSAVLLALKSRWEQTLPGIRIVENDPSGLLILSPPSGEAEFVSWSEDYPDPQDWLAMVAIVPGSATWTLYHESKADALVAQAEATQDSAVRLALYHQAEMALINDAIVIPLAQHEIQMRVRPGVVSLPLHLDWWIAPDAWAKVYLAAPAN